MCRLQAARVWLKRLSNSPSSPGTLSIPPSTSDLSEEVAMSSIPMNQSLEDQFLHWGQEMEKKQEEQTRQMKELQRHAERLQHENDQLRPQIEKSRDPRKYVQDSSQVVHPIACNRGKEPIIPDDVDTTTNDELSSGSSPSLSLSPTKNAHESTKAKSHKKPLHHPAFSDVISGASCKARKEVGRR